MPLYGHYRELGQLHVLGILGKIAAKQASENPRRLFRYRQASTPYFRDEISKLILNGELFFPSQSNLNDPSDCMPAIDLGVPYSEFKKRVYPVIASTQIAQYKKQYERGELHKLQYQFKKKKMKNLPDVKLRGIYEKMLTEYLPEVCRNIGVLSLTTSNQNMVMWSMYAKNEHGVCIQLEAHDQPDRKMTPIAVSYTKDRPTFNFYGLIFYLARDASIMPMMPLSHLKIAFEGIQQCKFLYTKGERWSYEEEYRIIDFDNRNHYISILPWHVTAVYVGAKISEADVSFIRELVVKSKSKPALYSVHLSASNYEMEFRSF
jgi:ribosomal protein S8